jgi:hypothetical protein
MILSAVFALRAARLGTALDWSNRNLSTRWRSNAGDPLAGLLRALHLKDGKAEKAFWLTIAAMLLTALAAARIGQMAF